MVEVTHRRCEPLGTYRVAALIITRKVTSDAHDDDVAWASVQTAIWGNTGAKNLYVYTTVL